MCARFDLVIAAGRRQIPSSRSTCVQSVPRAAHRYFLTAERFDAHEAYRIGLVHGVCVPEALDSTIGQIVEALLAGGPQAQAAAKRLITDITDEPNYNHATQLATKRFADIRATSEAPEGIGAFLHKRKPAWVEYSHAGRRSLAKAISTGSAS